MQVAEDTVVQLPDVHATAATDDVLPWFTLPEAGLRAATLSLRWSDQGFGNRKGKLFARCPGASWMPLTENPAPHSDKKLVVSLPSSVLGSGLELGYVVGGGGGHELLLSNAKLTVSMAEEEAECMMIELPHVHASEATDAVLPWYTLPGVGLEAATLSLRWCDQGFGNRKGRIFARCEGTPWMTLTERPAPHSDKALDVSLPSSLFGAAELELGYVVGGGGGHELFLSNAKLAVSIRKAHPNAGSKKIRLHPGGGRAQGTSATQPASACEEHPGFAGIERPWKELFADCSAVEPGLVAAMKASLWQKCKADVVSNAVRRKEMEERAVTATDGKEMRFTCRKVGAKPTAGYPVYICLHGGGGCAATVNDEQHCQMQHYYLRSVRSGIYVACRACEDSWKCHWVKASWPCYDRIIQNMIAFMDADPNRVYILGYSAGGDGVYQIAPRLADRWAGANMSAGHPNNVSITNLYHVPFLLQMGEMDGAYNRNKVVVQYYKQLQEKAQMYPGGYISECWVHQGAEHSQCKDHDPSGKANPVVGCNGCADGYEQCNTNAVHWLDQHTRNPTPVHLIWDVGTGAHRTRPDGAITDGLAEPRHRFYWLDISGGGNDAACVEAKIDREKNRIHVVSLGSWLRLLLDGRLVDMTRPVEISGEHFCFTVQLMPSIATMSRTLVERGDPELSFESEVILLRDASQWRVEVPCGEVVQ